MRKKLLTIALAAPMLLTACMADRDCGCSCHRDGCSAEQINKTPAYFAFDSSILSMDDKENLDQVAARLKANPNENVRISGYTDDVGPADYNMTLSKQRAQSAAKYLESLGIPSHRIKTVGYGATRFADQNATQAGRAKNRRVEVSFFH